MFISILLYMTGIDVKKIRLKLGISQEKLAEMIGVAPRTVQNWESGTKIPKSRYAILRNISKDVEKGEVKIEKDNTESVTMPREVFDQITKLTETVLSQQRTIESQQDSFKELVSRKNDTAANV